METNKFNVKENPENSSIIQALLDISKAGAYPANEINAMICLLRADSSSLQEAEKLFHSHLYPDHKITFCKLECEVEFARFLSANAIAVLTAMCQNMRHSNLIQLNRKDIVKISALKSEKPVTPAMQELLNSGCIAIKIPGTTRRGPVYMVNPGIATVGTKTHYLQKSFWELTGSIYHTKQVECSEPHKQWNKLTANRTYSKGYSSLETEDSEKPIYFSKINEPKIKAVKKKANPSDNNKPDTSTQHVAEPNEQNAYTEPESGIDGIDTKLPF